MPKRWSGAPAPGMEEAIVAAGEAGCFWIAAKMNPKAADMWEGYARAAHAEADQLLNTALRRSVQRG